MYILRCAGESSYVGTARDLEHRLAHHNDGEGAAYTSTCLPIRLVYFEKFERIDDTYRREKQRKAGDENADRTDPGASRRSSVAEQKALSLE